MVERVGAIIDDCETMVDWARTFFVNRLLTVTVDPSNVENEPDVREKDEMVSVELTVKVSTTICALEMDENIP